MGADVYRSFPHQQTLGQCLLADEAFLATYDRLVLEVVLPFLRSRTVGLRLDSRRRRRGRRRRRRQKNKGGKAENDEEEKKGAPKQGGGSGVGKVKQTKGKGRKKGPVMKAEGQPKQQTRAEAGAREEEHPMAQLWMHDEGALALAMRYGGPFTAAGEKRHRNEGKGGIDEPERGELGSEEEEEEEEDDDDGEFNDDEDDDDDDEEEDDDNDAEVLSTGETCFYYQFPPTLRLQPGPSDRIGGRAHSDAEYGHQDGEVNFWLPLTDYALTRTALWVESAPGRGDFHPLDCPCDPGSLVAFHGTRCRHVAAPNPSPHTRASLDFRIGVGRFFDAKWVLNGTKHDHGRKFVQLADDASDPQPRQQQ